MKVTETERSYCIEITKAQFSKLMDKDFNSLEKYDQVSGRYSYPATLCSVICKISGVREVTYDPMCSPAIFVRLESEDTAAMVRTLENVKREIALYVK